MELIDIRTCTGPSTMGQSLSLWRTAPVMDDNEIFSDVTTAKPVAELLCFLMLVAG